MSVFHCICTTSFDHPEMVFHFHFNFRMFSLPQIFPTVLDWKQKMNLQFCGHLDQPLYGRGWNETLFTAWNHYHRLYHINTRKIQPIKLSLKPPIHHVQQLFRAKRKSSEYQVQPVQERLKDLHRSVGITLRIIIISVLYSSRTSLRDLHERFTSQNKTCENQMNDCVTLQHFIETTSE